MTGHDEPGFPGLNTVGTLAALKHREVNYSTDEVTGPAWNFDSHRTPLPAERPGAPEAGGVWEKACQLVRDYEFSAPELVRAAYDPAEPLLGRDMLLEGRFSALRLYLGVRITSVVDETRTPDRRVWGWGYQTLRGHLERGRISYEVIKHQNTGDVEFVINAYSQSAPTLGPVMRLGWSLFGRQRQLGFYQRCGQRMNRFAGSAQLPSGSRTPSAARPSGHEPNLVIAPSDARPHLSDRFALRRSEPG